MAALEHIPDVTKISERVIRVLGQNPGKFTLQGTNIYLLGTSNPYVLVDAGEGREEFIPTLESVLTSIAAPTNPELPDVSDIIISHWHHDHVGGLPTVLPLLKRLFTARNPNTSYTPPRIHKHPLAAKPTPSEIEHNRFPKVLASIDPTLYTHSSSGPLHDLQANQVLTAKDTTLRFLHTPGHTHDSICLYIPEDRALYTADTVLGHGTAVFEDLTLYLASLNKMLQYEEEYTSILPSHGPVVKDPKETITTYIKHRLEREAQVLALLANEVDDHWSTWTIVKKLYASYPENLLLPAMRGINLHLMKLELEGKIKNVGVEPMEVQGFRFENVKWLPTSRTPSPSL